MTATLLATYVGDGRLNWNDTLQKLIPDSCQDSHPDVRRISVLQLLQHRSGLPANLLSWWFVPSVGQRGKILPSAAPPTAKPTPPKSFL